VRPKGEIARAASTGTLRHILPGYSFQPIDVYALLPKGRIKLPRIALCIDALRQAISDIA
jgi:DNA-binding transcriptional LysR family regulator